MNVIDLNDKDYEELIFKFYTYFKNAFDFEKFLKPFLTTNGLDEVTVTRRTRDGGIDLIGKRRGLGGFSNEDDVKYYVQAKRNNPKNKVDVKKIRELRGVMPSGTKRLFITTSDFTKNAKEEALKDSFRPIILINGKRLIDNCIDNELGMLYKPVFSKISIDNLISREKELTENISDSIHVEKLISKNDIRARILPIPSVILETIPPKSNKLKVYINKKEEILNINRERKYLGGITKIYRDNGIITSENSFSTCISDWRIKGDKIIIEFLK